jgi:hypothetical protein
MTATLELCGFLQGELSLVEVQLADASTVAAIAGVGSGNCIEQTASPLNQVIVSEESLTGGFVSGFGGCSPDNVLDVAT